MTSFAEDFHIRPWETRQMTVLEFRHFVARAEALNDAREKERAELDAMRR